MPRQLEALLASAEGEASSQGEHGAFLRCLLLAATIGLSIADADRRDGSVLHFSIALGLDHAATGLARFCAPGLCLSVSGEAASAPGTISEGTGHAKKKT
jgi:hypothetical protein